MLVSWVWDVGFDGWVHAAASDRGRNRIDSLEDDRRGLGVVCQRSRGWECCDQEDEQSEERDHDESDQWYRVWGVDALNVVWFVGIVGVADRMGLEDGKMLSMMERN
jgi:hypothetical protein